MTLTCACVSLAALGSGQEVLHYIDSEEPGVGRNHVFPAGDHDGDGAVDYAVACACSQAGGVRVYSGSDGQVLWRRESTGSVAREVSVLDYNGDGVQDYAVSMPFGNGAQLFSGRVEIYDGVDSSTLRVFVGHTYSGYFGWNIDTVGDLDGDGKDELIVSSQPITDTVKIYRGGDGAVLREHPPQTRYASVAGLGDVDGDGIGDYVIGSGEAGGGGPGSGMVRVYSGADGSVIYLWLGSPAGVNLGSWVANAGDVDADGVPDILAGAPGAIITSLGSEDGHVQVFSGADGSLVHHLTPLSTNKNFGQRVEGGGDINGDGFDDVLVGSSRQGGELYVFSGNTGGLLWWKEGSPGTSLFGREMAIVGDTNGDGLDEWAYSDNLFVNDFGAPGRLFICSGSASDAEEVCPGEPNSTGQPARLALEGSISLTDANLKLIVTDLPGEQPGLFFYGEPSPGTPFGNGELCMGAGSAGLQRLGPAQFASATGTLERTLDFDAPPVGSGPGAWLVGTAWTTQLWYRDPSAGGSAFNLSSAIEIAVAP